MILKIEYRISNLNGREVLIKMSGKYRLSQNELGVLIAITACIIGGGIRLYTAFQAGFPINDGGLFYVMTKAIQQNGYILPKFVHYNGLDIPFAYPPLGFYFAGLVSDITRVSLIEVFRWLPAIILSISIYPFYILATCLMDSKVESGVATLVYALLPRTIAWLIMGGGITRSLGQLFLIIAIYNIYMLFSKGGRKYLWLSIISGSLVCLTHPEATIHTAGIAILIWLFKGRNKEGVLYGITLAASIFILTSIWWLPAFINFGSTPFFSAAQTGLHNFLFIVYFLTIPFSAEPYLTVIILLAVIGIAVSISKKEYLLPLFYTAPFIIEPRNAANVNTLFMAMLASIALCQLILPGLKKLEEQQLNIEYQNYFQSRSGKVLLSYFLLTSFIGMLYFSTQLFDNKVSQENLNAFNWVRKNTPEKSQFLVMTGNTDLFGDWTLEWFPALTNRVSLTTIQGREWLDGNLFLDRVNNIRLTQRCIMNSSPLECIEDRTTNFDSDYDYIYIAKKTALEEYDTTIRGDSLILELSQAKEQFLEVYRTDEVRIYQHLH